MKFIDSPLGRLEVNEADDGARFAQGRYGDVDGGIFFSIKLEDDGSLSEGMDFVRSRIDNISKFTALASKYLANVIENATSNGEVPLVWGEEFTFWGGGGWSILFAEGVLDICDPYGVMVNFSDDEVIGYEDLSSAEEV
ncbi:hypothetical protein [Xanthomonas bromi]|uniref:Uncharacterized protein n=1 Tax=Xanthomonas bromi TaxID=56449 RepID=A0ABX5BL98_9XANT|nr:hypothetical protein [Xanthomonas bromi]PPV04657.1 hypothetical protein XbrCFBP1976_21155 [Xanthomonas bromi]